MVTQGTIAFAISSLRTKRPTLRLLRHMVTQMGFEPMAHGLKVRCATTALLGHIRQLLQSYLQLRISSGISTSHYTLDF